MPQIRYAIQTYWERTLKKHEQRVARAKSFHFDLNEWSLEHSKYLQLLKQYDDKAFHELSHELFKQVQQFVDVQAPVSRYALDDEGFFDTTTIPVASGSSEDE